MITFGDIFAEIFGFAHSSVFTDAFQVLITMSPIVLAIILFMIFWPLWVRYVRAAYFLKEKYCIIEIRLPKETFKSPKAMELFLTALHQTGGESNWYDKYWLGKTRTWFSLEMISIEGQVKFLIWMRSSWRPFIESSLYAQFPGVEVHEMPDDYARSTHFDPKTVGLWACEFIFSKPDAYPIKTYVDYGLDKDPKEEFKVDPLAPLIEFLGSIGANQQVWFQLLVRAHKGEQPKGGHWWKTTDKWKDGAKAEVDKILMRDPESKITGQIDESGRGQQVSISEGEKEIVTSIERGLTKLAFDVGVRAMYIADNKFFAGTNIPGIIGSMKQFNSEHLNGFKPNSKKWNPKFSYPWQDFNNIRQNKTRKEALAAYKRRSFFFHPYKDDKPLIMNTEELATMFHFPGQVSQTPTFARVQSKKGEAPGDLPI